MKISGKSPRDIILLHVRFIQDRLGMGLVGGINCPQYRPEGLSESAGNPAQERTLYRKSGEDR